MILFNILTMASINLDSHLQILLIAAGAMAFVSLLVILYLAFIRRLFQTRNKKSLVFESNFIEIDGVTLHYQQMGSGPPLILLHGIGASLFTWRMIVPELSKSHTVVAIDLPGFGDSSKHLHRKYGLDEQAQLLHDFLNTIGIKQATLMGSSMGALIGLWMAKLWPDSYLNVIAISPPLSPKILPFDPSRLHKFARPMRLIVNRPFITGILRRVYNDQHLVTKETIHNYARPYLDSGESVQTFLLATKSVTDSRIPSELANIKSRVLLLWGERDRILPIKISKIGLDVIPNVFFESHPKAGHHPMEDQPDWVIEKTNVFLREDI